MFTDPLLCFSCNTKNVQVFILFSLQCNYVAAVTAHFIDEESPLVIDCYFDCFHVECLCVSQFSRHQVHTCLSLLHPFHTSPMDFQLTFSQTRLHSLKPR